ncbi:MAG TPA: hypothetical protein DCE41_07210 [Cytophagales bacterium]|nr:hypothetical protein [Cytophagales bacterium]
MRFLVAFLLFPFFGWSQSTDSIPPRSSAVGGGIGATSYRGDVNPSYQNFSLEGNIYFILNTQSRLSAGFVAYAGNFTGQNPNLTPQVQANGDIIQPTRFFRTSYQGLALLPRLKVVELSSFSLFVAQGVGILRFQPQNESGENLIDIPATRPTNETFGNSTVHFPTQVHLQWQWNPALAWQVQVGLMNTLTDYLDNTGELGERMGNDNLLSLRLILMVTLPNR